MPVYMIGVKCCYDKNVNSHIFSLTYDMKYELRPVSGWDLIIYMYKICLYIQHQKTIMKITSEDLNDKHNLCI